jgi:hypothetical protein
MITNPSQRHDTIAAAVLTAVVGLAGIGALLTAALRATGHPAVAGWVLAGLVVLVVVGRWVTRILRERREDTADALAGAAWRAHHMPHAASRPEPAGVA